MQRYVKKPPEVDAEPWDGVPAEGMVSDGDGRWYFVGCFKQKHYVSPGDMILVNVNGKPCSAMTREKFEQEWKPV